MNLDKVVTPEFVSYVRKRMAQGQSLPDATGSALAIRGFRPKSGQKLDDVERLFPGYRYGHHADPLRVMERVRERIAFYEEREARARAMKPAQGTIPALKLVPLSQEGLRRHQDNRAALAERLRFGQKPAGIRPSVAPKPAPMGKPAPATRHWRMVKNGVVIAEGTSRF